MTDTEINRRLAKALGFEVRTLYGLDYVVNSDGVWLGLGHATGVQEFTPATSVDNLRKWVLPELIAKNAWISFHYALLDSIHAKQRELGISDDVTYMTFILLLGPAVLAAGAAAVLEADNG